MHDRTGCGNKEGGAVSAYRAGQQAVREANTVRGWWRHGVTTGKRGSTNRLPPALSVPSRVLRQCAAPSRRASAAGPLGSWARSAPRALGAAAALWSSRRFPSPRRSFSSSSPGVRIPALYHLIALTIGTRHELVSHCFLLWERNSHGIASGKSPDLQYHQDPYLKQTKCLNRRRLPCRTSGARYLDHTRSRHA